MIAVSARPTPTTSVSMWAASEMRARDEVAKPTANSTTMKTAAMANAALSAPRWRPDALVAP
jgi:hypothetical protein